MDFSGTTFILEIINFLVLVWILKKLLFAPLHRIIEERQAFINKALSDADEKNLVAEKIQDDFRNRLKNWESEKLQKEDALEKELQEKRIKKLESLEVSLQEERMKRQAQDLKIIEDQMAINKKESLKYSYQLTSKLLEEFTGPEVEERIIKETLEQIKKSEEHKKIDQISKDGLEVKIKSAFNIPEYEREQLIKELFGDGSGENKVKFEEDPSLIAGLEISIDTFLIQANLRDELAYLTSDV